MDSINDLCGYGELYGAECSTIAVVCAWATLVERAVHRLSDRQDFPLREAFLDAMDTLALHEFAPPWAIKLVISGIDRENLDVSEVDAYDSLVEHLAEAQDGPSASGTADPTWLLGIVRELTGQFALQRRNGINEIAKAIAAHEINEHEARTLAAIVGWLAVIEESDSPRAGILECLTNLANHDLVPPATVELLTSEFPREQASAKELEAYNALLATFRDH